MYKMYVRLGAGASTILEKEREAVSSRRVEGSRKSRELVRQHLSKKTSHLKWCPVLSELKSVIFSGQLTFVPALIISLKLHLPPSQINCKPQQSRAARPACTGTDATSLCSCCLRRTSSRVKSSVVKQLKRALNYLEDIGWDRVAEYVCCCSLSLLLFLMCIVKVFLNRKIQAKRGKVS